MIYTENTKKAMNLCFEAHKDQKDKSGFPYVFHPFHLAEQMTDEESTVVALLHDVVEDSAFTIKQIKGFGFSNAIIEAVMILTHDPQVPYMDYIDSIKRNSIAKKVKLADLKHNSDMSRLDKISDEDIKRVSKYEKAIKRLMD